MTTVEEVTQRIGALEQALAQANMIIVGMRQSQEQDRENIERLMRGAAGGIEGAGGRGREGRRPPMSSKARIREGTRLFRQAGGFRRLEVQAGGIPGHGACMVSWIFSSGRRSSP